MSAIAGLRGTGDFAANELPEDFREYILWRNPNGDTPVTAFLGKAGKQACRSRRFHWWDESQDIVRVTASGTTVTAGTSIVITSGDPTTTNPERVYGSALNLKAGDILMREPVAEATTYASEHMIVASVTNATTFTVARGAAGTTPGQFTHGTALTLIGSAYAEGTGAPDAASRNPLEYVNYTQIFKETYDVTGTVEQEMTRTGDPVKNDRKRKMWDHARAIEMALLFGLRSTTTGANGKPLRTTNGLRAQINTQNVTIFGTTPTVTTVLDAIYPVFDFNTMAGNTRIAICGNRALNGVNAMIHADSGSEMKLGEKIKMYGWDLREYILPQGSIYLRTHPFLNRHPVLSKSMWIIDFSALKWRYLRNRDTKFKDNVQNNDEDRRKGLWLTEGGLQVDYGGLTCGYLGNVTYP